MNFAVITHAPFDKMVGNTTRLFVTQLHSAVRDRGVERGRNDQMRNVLEEIY